MGRYLYRRRQKRGLDALTSGIIAVGAGDRALAVRYAAQARKALPHEPLTHLLRAQAAQIGGDRATARRIFEAMLASPETEQLGLRGLFLEAEREGEKEAARQFAERALQRNPKLGWPVEALFELQCRAQDWQGALDTLAIARRQHLIDKAPAARRRAVLLTAQAQALEDADADKALELAQEAHRLAPDLVPAAAIAGRVLAARGNTPRAARVLLKTWRLAPHPDLAAAYAYARPGDSPRDRLNRVRHLARLTPNHAEAQIAVAISAIEARDWNEARKALEPLLDDRLTPRVCTLMARIEGEQNSDAGRVREWLARAANAARDPAWTADGVVSDHWSAGIARDRRARCLPLARAGRGRQRPVRRVAGCQGRSAHCARVRRGGAHGNGADRSRRDQNRLRPSSLPIRHPQPAPARTMPQAPVVTPAPPRHPHPGPRRHLPNGTSSLWKSWSRRTLPSGEHRHQRRGPHQPETGAAAALSRACASLRSRRFSCRRTRRTIPAPKRPRMIFPPIPPRERRREVVSSGIRACEYPGPRGREDASSSWPGSGSRADARGRDDRFNEEPGAMEFDALTLARLQFAFTVSFHIIFPAFTIGIASYLAVLEGLWLYTGRNVFLALFNYWKKIFAISFGMGVVSGIVMSYQFGTNWSVFSDKTGPILGPLMGYEVLAAFFLEAGFLGVMLFGMERVGKRLHFFATLMVAAGTLMSAFWILAANSWMHTPAGFALNAAGQFVATDWWAVIFNPSFPYRLVHMVLAAYLTTAFVVGAVGAFHLLARPRQRRRARDVLHGHVDGRHRRADPGGGGRPARPQHAGAPAREDRRHGGTLGDGRGPAAHPVRLARHGSRDDALRHRDPQARQLHPHARLERRR